MLHKILNEIKKIMRNKVIREKSRSFNCNSKKLTFLKQHKKLIAIPKTNFFKTTKKLNIEAPNYKTC